MKKFLEDLFMTNGKYDVTNPAYSYIPGVISLFCYTVMGLYGGWHGIHIATAINPFDLGSYLRSWAEGFGAMSSLIAVGTWLHSKAVN